MKSVLLVGLGRFGEHIAKKLNELNHEVMAIDSKEERIDNILPYVTNAQIGDSTDEGFMRTLGIKNFDLCIVAIGDDFQSSLETTCLLKELGAKHVVARASRGVHAKFLARNGADDVIYPERQMANWAAIRFSADHILDYISIDEDYAVFEVMVPDKWVGKSVGQLGVRPKYNVNIMALKRNGKFDMNINADTVLTREDSMLVLGSHQNIHKCFPFLDK